MRKRHHITSHQLHDEFKREVPDISSSELAFEKGCKDRRPGDYHFDDYFLNYPLPDCPTEENTTTPLPSFSTAPDSTTAPCKLFFVVECVCNPFGSFSGCF